MVMDRSLKAQSREAEPTETLRASSTPLEESANGKQQCEELATFPMEPRFG